jgi:hypothetical protein
MCIDMQFQPVVDGNPMMFNYPIKTTQEIPFTAFNFDGTLCECPVFWASIEEITQHIGCATLLFIAPDGQLPENFRTNFQWILAADPFINDPEFFIKTNHLCIFDLDIRGSVNDQTKHIKWYVKNAEYDKTQELRFIDHMVELLPQSPVLK